MKKILTALLGVCSLCCFALGFASCGNTDNSRYTIYADGYTIQLLESGAYSILEMPEEVRKSGEWRIPETVGGYPISVVGRSRRSPSFGLGFGSAGGGPHGVDLEGIKRIYIPECITRIATPRLDDVRIWEAEGPISQIKFDSYYSDNRLDPDRVVLIAPYEERWAKSFRYVTKESIVDNMSICVDESGENATMVFAYGEGTLEIPDTFQGVPVTKIAARACRKEGFEKLVFGQNLEEIGEEAFASCTALAEMDCSNAPLTSIGELAFAGCPLTEMDLSQTHLKELGKNAFQNCKLLKNVTFPEGVLSIEEGAFRNCEKLSAVQLPESLTDLGDEAFSACSALTSLRIPQRVETLNETCISGCSGLEYLHFYMEKERILAWDDSAGSRRDWANEFPKLYVEITDGEEELIVEDGVMYSKDKRILYRTLGCGRISSLVIDSEIVCKKAFYGDTTLLEVRFTERCKTVDASVFHACTNLKRVIFSRSLESLGVGAFANCTSLTELDTCGVKTIEASCFAGCRSLQTVNLPNCVRILEAAFVDCDLRAVTLGEYCEEVGANAFAWNKNLTFFAANGCTNVDPLALYGTPLYKEE